MGRFLSLVLLAVTALLLNSCTTVCTHRAVADRGQQYRAIILPDQENLVLYRHHGKLYLQGVLTTVRRTQRDKVTATPGEFFSGQFVPIKGAPQYYVYRELQPGDIDPNEEFSVLPGKAIPRGAHVVGSRRNPVAYRMDALNCNPVTTSMQYGWKSALPKGAYRVYTPMVTSEHQQVGSHLCNTRSGFIIPISRHRANRHALYAYPAAGLSFVLIDVPGTILANTVVPVAYGIAAIPCSIYQKGKQFIVKPSK